MTITNVTKQHVALYILGIMEQEDCELIENALESDAQVRNWFAKYRELFGEDPEPELRIPPMSEITTNPWDKALYTLAELKAEMDEEDARSAPETSRFVSLPPKRTDGVRQLAGTISQAASTPDTDADVPSDKSSAAIRFRPKSGCVDIELPRSFVENDYGVVVLRIGIESECIGQILVPVFFGDDNFYKTTIELSLHFKSDQISKVSEKSAGDYLTKPQDILDNCTLEEINAMRKSHEHWPDDWKKLVDKLIKDKGN